LIASTVRHSLKLNLLQASGLLLTLVGSSEIPDTFIEMNL